MLKIAELAETIKENNGGNKKNERGRREQGYKQYENRNTRHNDGRRNSENRNRHNNNRSNQYNRNDRPYKNNRNEQSSSLAEQNKKFDRPDDKNGWGSTEVKALLGAGAVIGGGVAAAKGQLKPDSKYVKDAGNKAFQGMRKYMGKNSKPLTRVISNVVSRSYKDIKRGIENPHKTRASKVMDNAKDLNNRARGMNDHVVKQKAAESFEKARNYNAFEKELAGKEKRVPQFMEEDFTYHMNRAKEDILKSRPEMNKKPGRLEEMKNIFGTSLIGGASFGVGLSAIHGIEKALESKDDEAKNRNRREQQFRSLGSFV